MCLCVCEARPRGQQEALRGRQERTRLPGDGWLGSAQLRGFFPPAPPTERGGGGGVSLPSARTHSRTPAGGPPSPFPEPASPGPLTEGASPVPSAGDPRGGLPRRGPPARLLREGVPDPSPRGKCALLGTPGGGVYPGTSHPRGLPRPLSAGRGVPLPTYPWDHRG